MEAADTWQGIVPGGAAARSTTSELGGTFLLTATPLTSADGHTLGRVLVARDITRQTRLEAERAALRERLTQSEKLASLGQFVAGIAHEMNNPLQGVLGHLELLMDMTPAAKPVKRELQADLPGSGSRREDRPQPAGVHRVASHRAAEDAGRSRPDARAIASREGAPDAAPTSRSCASRAEKLPPIMCDPAHLQQAFLNVLINAEHAVARRRRGAAHRDHDGARKPRKNGHVTIRDCGPGIAAEVLPRIFDPFFTTKDVGQGTGLGLAITYGIVQEHGGTITAAQRAGRRRGVPDRASAGVASVIKWSQVPPTE